MPDGLDPLAEEIHALLRRQESRLGEEVPGHAPAAWEADARSLSWHVVLEGALEPDVDVEILPHAIVVRVLALGGEVVRGAVLPVPEEFDLSSPSLRFEEGVLHVRVTRIRGAGR